MADQNHQERNFYTLPGVSEVEKSDFINENFHFFTLTYFPIFQDGGQKSSRKEFSTIPGGFRGWKKPFFK